MRLYSRSLREKLDQAEKAMQDNEWPKAASLWQEALVKMKRAPSRVHVGLAESYRQQGLFVEAEAAAQEAAHRFPNDIGVLMELAEAQSYLEKWQEASKTWQKIVDNKDYKAPARAWAKLTGAYRNQGDNVAAEKVAKLGLQHYPDHKLLLIEAARTATVQGLWHEAAELWGKVIDRIDASNSTAVSAYINLATAQRTLGLISEAEGTINQGLEKYPDSIDIAFEYAQSALLRKDWPESLKRWQKFIDLFGNRPANIASQQARLNISILKRLVGIDKYKSSIKTYQKHKKSGKQNKLAIVTSYTKGYDSLMPPEFVDPDIDYVAYTDEEADGMGVFDVRPLPISGMDGARLIRYAKTHPHILFKDYEAVIWVDTSIMIVNDLKPLIRSFLKSGKAIGSTPHSLRKTAYEELEACLKLNKDNPEIMRKQMEVYKSEGFDGKGLAENGFLLFNVKHPLLGPILETWWQQICDYSKRDQLSFGYAHFKHQADWFPTMQPPQSIRDNDLFIVAPHHTEHIALNELKQQLIEEQTHA